MGRLRGLALPGRTVRLRFTLLYAAVFLGSGIGLLALTNLLSAAKVTEQAPGPQPGPQTSLAAAQQQIRHLQAELAGLEAAQARRLLVGSLLALLVMAVVSVVLGKVTAVRVLRPLRTITAATRRISADNLHERLAVAGPADEVKDLADTIDALLGRLDAAFAAQRRFVADASHELRTPLATMRASVDVAMAKPEPHPQTTVLAGRVRTELDRVERLLDGFLMLARAQHGALPDRGHVCLGRLAGQAVTARAGDVAARGLTVEVTGGQAAWTEGSVTLLSRMVQNLVDNAVVHSPAGGRVRVATTAGETTAELVVENGGPLLDPAQAAGLAQPFRRLGAARTGSDDGSGIGLSIVAAVVGAHGGRLDLHARPEGGLRATVSLPRTAEPSQPAPREPAQEPGRPEASPPSQLAPREAAPGPGQPGASPLEAGPDEPVSHGAVMREAGA